MQCLACRSVTSLQRYWRHREKYFRLGPARDATLEVNHRGNTALRSSHVFGRQLELLASRAALSKPLSSVDSSLASHASSARSHPPPSARTSSLPRELVLACRAGVSIELRKARELSTSAKGFETALEKLKARVRRPQT